MKYVVTYSVFASTPMVYEFDSEEQARSKVVELVDMHLGYAMEFAPSPEGHATMYDEAMSGTLPLEASLGVPQAAAITVYAMLSVPDLRRLQAVAKAASDYFDEFDLNIDAGYAVRSDLRAALRELEGR